MPPPPAALDECLLEWQRFLADRSRPLLVRAGLAHAQFKAIHPIVDGNGRTGRVLTALLLVEDNALARR